MPVSLSFEKDGFVLNRLQYAVLGECWRLVTEGVVSAQDMDVVVSQGMGLRYAFLGIHDPLLEHRGLEVCTGCCCCCCWLL